MTMTIGRLGTDGLLLNSPDADVGSISRDGDVMTVRGKLVNRGATPSLTVAQARIQAAQIQGLAANVDEMVIPFTDSENPHLDGFYVPLDTGVSDPEDPDIVYFPYTVKLARVPGSQAPLFQVRCSGEDRDTALSPSVASWLALPDDATGLYLPDFGGSTVTRAGETNTAIVYYEAASFYDTSASFQIAVDDYYKTAATIYTLESRVASSTAPTWTRSIVVGHQIPNLPTRWMLDNELMRVLPGPNSGEYLIGQWQPGTASWTYKAYKLTGNGATATNLGDPVTVTVLRNSPECVSIRCWFDSGTKGGHVDFTLRRGAVWVEGRFQGPSNGNTIGVFRYSTEAGTTAGVTGGINANADDGDNNKYKIRSPQDTVKRTTEGGLYLNFPGAPETYLDFAISTDLFATLDIDNGYWAAQRHRQRIVAR